MRTRWIIALLLLIPFSDALLLIPVAEWLGPLQTVALVVLTGLVGMMLVRAEGRTTLRRIQQRLAIGELPANQLLDGGLLIAAGAFLLTPGLVTDTLGFLLAIPVTRYPIRTVIKRYVVKPYLDKQADGFVSGGVWTGGFPYPDEGDDVYDVDSNAYRFDDDGDAGTDRSN
ncbi:FxsA family protein [Haloprofundus halobius]|uniref:FxsA family protein n=1 Tax=Haloprofundus halobius TaxID=2876194 RepID=UPI001CCF7867|nr:FxsA family protein [Haloprofundus halobius]